MKVIVTGRQGPIPVYLSDQGLEVRAIRVLRHIPVPGYEQAIRAWATASTTTTKIGVITSVTTVNYIRDLAEQLRDVQIWTSGPGTTQALIDAGFDAHTPAQARGTQGLIDHFTHNPISGDYLVAGSILAEHRLEDFLRARGLPVTRVDVYRTATDQAALAGLEQAWDWADVVVVTSPSTTESIAHLLTKRPPGHVVAIGTRTADAIKRLGLSPLVAAQPTGQAIYSLLQGVHQ